MELGEEIVLRPRFKIELDRTKESILQDFKKETTTEFTITQTDTHVFIKIPKNKQHFWSPQLDLELSSFEEGKCTLRGLFGPKPAVWTMFMFFHFVVIVLFILAGVWAYTNFSLQKPIALQIAGMIFLIVIWVALYFSGRLGKQAGKKEMIAQYKFMVKTIGL